MTDINPRGEIQLASETWSAEIMEGEEPIYAGEPVVSVKVEGLRVFVRRPGKRV